MIGSSKNNRENYLRKCFWTQEKETRVKFNPGLSRNRPSNKLAQAFSDDGCYIFPGLSYNKANNTFLNSLTKNEVEAQVEKTNSANSMLYPIQTLWG